MVVAGEAAVTEVVVVAGEVVVVAAAAAAEVVHHPWVDQPDRETGSAPIPTVATTTSPGVTSATVVRPAGLKVQEVVMMMVDPVVAVEAVVVTEGAVDSAGAVVVIAAAVVVVSAAVAVVWIGEGAAVDSVADAVDQTDGEVTVEIVVTGRINLYLRVQKQLSMGGTGRNGELCNIGLYHERCSCIV